MHSDRVLATTAIATATSLVPVHAEPQGFGEPRRMFPSALDDTTGVAIGDPDVDGDLDAWIGNGASPTEPDRLYLKDAGRIPSVARFVRLL